MKLSFCRGLALVLAAFRQPALLAVAAVVLLVAAFCWTVTNRERTANAVDLISALRGRQAGEKHSGRRRGGPSI